MQAGGSGDGGPSRDRCGCGQHLSFASRVRWGGAAPVTTSTHRSRLAFDGHVLCQPPAPPVVRVSRSMGVCCASHHLHLSLASADRWGCALPATTSTFVRVSRLMGVCFASHQPHPSFTSGVRWGCAVPATSSTFHSRLPINGVCFASHQLHLSFASRDRWGCAVRATTSTLRLHLPIDGGVLCQPPPPPVVRVSRSMGVSCASIVRVLCGCGMPLSTSTRRSRPTRRVHPVRG